jgi:hypothetical protein
MSEVRMPTIIKIDRSTVRPNPNAGQTAYRVAGRSYTEETKVFKRGHDWIKQQWSDGFMYRQDSITSLKCPSDWASSINHIQEYSDIHTLSPEPAFLYEYENPELVCDSCGGTFCHQDLLFDETNDWGGYISSYEVCPLCHEWDCCEVELEKL